MKREIPATVVYGALAVALVVVLVVGWMRYGGGGPEARGAAEFMAVSHRLSLAGGDATKLSEADQEYIKNHPSGFRPHPSSGGPGSAAGQPTPPESGGKGAVRRPSGNGAL